MAHNPPLRGVAYEFYVSLRSQANVKVFQANPTLAAGDVKVSKDGGALANLTTLPAAVSSSKLVKVNLSATEMTADNVTVIFSDAAGAEWCDLAINIQTVNGAIPANMKQISDDTGAADALEAMLDGTGGGKLHLAQLNVQSAGNDAAVYIRGAGTGAGMDVKGGLTDGDGAIIEGGGTNGNGIRARGNGSGAGLLGAATGSGEGIRAQNLGTGNGLAAFGGGTTGDAMHLDGAASGYDLRLKDARHSGLAPGIADAVWDEALAGHTTAGSAGAAMSGAGSDLWSTALPGSYGAGTAGHILGHPLAADAAQLGGSTTAAENLRDGALGLRRGTATSGTLSTTQMTTNVTGLPADVVVGRLVTFLPPGALQYQQRRIIDYVAANGLITVDAALTQAVLNGQTFVIQ